MTQQDTLMSEQLYDLVDKIRLITRSGKIVNLRDFDPALIDDRDIAYALSHINRWTGHAPGANVAWHTSIVAEQCGRAWDMLRPDDVSKEELVLAGWLHDAPETYVNDCVRLKKHLGEAYSAIEGPIHDRIFIHYGLKPAIGHHPILKLADTQAGRIEAMSFKFGSGAKAYLPLDLDPGQNGACFPDDMFAETLSAAKRVPWWDPTQDLMRDIPSVIDSRWTYLCGLRQAVRQLEERRLQETIDFALGGSVRISNETV